MKSRSLSLLRTALILSGIWAAFAAGLVAAAAPEAARPRLRDLGVAPGIFPPGPLNTITDVAGVRVGHRTLRRGKDVRTGVTVILPHTGNLFMRKTPAGVHVGNGFGKAAGFLQVMELGHIETPIVLTNTLSVGVAIDAVVSWTIARPGNEAVRSVNAVVGETNDGRLNDIRGRHVTTQDVLAAIEAASDGPVEEGSVGAGTGTVAFGWKGGIGTASRRLPAALGGWTVGVLVQSNFDGVLSVDGIPAGRALGRHPYRDQAAPRDDAPPDGSCMIVIATDAPLDARTLERIAHRGILGLARTGGFMSHGSGDFVIAFSTANLEPHDAGTAPRRVEILGHEALSPIFLAAVEGVEEAVLNSLLKATTTTGRQGHRAEAIPIDPLRALIEARRAPAPGD